MLDVLGIGFGPSNLGLAIALREHADAGRPLSVRFVERQERFGWHRGMLLDDAVMQVSFLKDLVTVRTPTSPYTFLSYLHAHDRILDFVNYGSPCPPRTEFHGYLEWVASHFADQVDFGCEAVEIRPAGPAYGADVVEVVVSTGDELRAYRTRNVVLAVGLRPHVPEHVELGDRVWHNRDLLFRLPELVGTAPERVTVLGAGQSAAETVSHLHRTFPDAEVCAVFARWGYSPADSSPFANRIFDPDAVADYHAAPAEVKQMLMGYHRNTNYSVVDPDLLESLYRTHYHERVAGRERLRFLNASAVSRVTTRADHVDVEVESLIDGSREVLASDLVVCATGYRSGDPLTLLGDLGAHCRRIGDRVDLGRDYRVATDDEVTAGVYVQGATEHTHGVASTLLSNVAVRTGEIAASIVARVRDLPAPARQTVSAGD